MHSPHPPRPASTSTRGFATLLALPVTLAVAGLAVVATQQGPSAPTDPDPIAAVRAHLASAPQDAAAWARLGTLELRQAAATHDPRHYPDADVALTRSLLLRPDGNTAALAGLAALRTAQHRFAESHDVARQALALDSQDPAVWGTLADAASGLGRDGEAHDAVAHMLDLRPDAAACIRSASLDELSGRVDVARAPPRASRHGSTDVRAGPGSRRGDRRSAAARARRRGRGRRSAGVAHAPARGRTADGAALAAAAVLRDRADDLLPRYDERTRRTLPPRLTRAGLDVLARAAAEHAAHVGGAELVALRTAMARAACRCTRARRSECPQPPCLAGSGRRRSSRCARGVRERASTIRCRRSSPISSVPSTCAASPASPP